MDFIQNNPLNSALPISENNLEKPSIIRLADPIIINTVDIQFSNSPLHSIILDLEQSIIDRDKFSFSNALFDAYLYQKQFYKDQESDPLMCCKKTISSIQPKIKKLLFMHPKNERFMKYIFYDRLKEIEKAESNLDLLYKTFQNHSNPILKHFPKDDLWRLFIDQDKKPKNLFSFNIMESNYIAPLLGTLALCIDHISVESLSYPSIEELHDMATHEVLNLKSGQFRSGFFCGCVYVDPDDCDCSEAGMREFESKCMIDENGQPGILYPYTVLVKKPIHTIESENKPLNGSLSFEYRFKSKGSLIQRMSQANRLVQILQRDFSNSISNESKFRSIVCFVQNLEQSHLFSDGNLRTSAMVLLNALLINANMTPVIWCNPNKIDGHSLDECCELVKQGQKRFLSYRKDLPS